MMKRGGGVEGVRSAGDAGRGGRWGDTEGGRNADRRRDGRSRQAQAKGTTDRLGAAT